MVHREDESAAATSQPAVRLPDPCSRQVALQGMAAQGHDHRRLQGAFLAVEVRRAGRYLIRLRIAVARRAALHDVGDEHVTPLPPDRLQELGEQLAGGTDERTSGRILPCT